MTWLLEGDGGELLCPDTDCMLKGGPWGSELDAVQEERTASSLLVETRSLSCLFPPKWGVLSFSGQFSSPSRPQIYLK